MKTFKRFALVLLGVYAVVIPAFSQTYSVTDLGPLDGAPTYASSINNRGAIAGFSRPDASSTHAWIWNSGIGFTDAGTLGGTTGGGNGVGLDGRLYGTSTDGTATVRGFVFDPVSLTMADIGSVAPGDALSVYGVNAAGTIVGATTTGGSTQGYSLSGETFTLLGTFAGADAPATSTASAINDAGRIAGLGSWVNGGTRAFRTDAGGALVQLGTLGGNDSRATAINNAGTVAGYSTIATGVTHAFVWFDGVGMKDLGYLDYAHDSRAYGINGAGDVVGTALDSTGASHAVAWLGSYGTRDLGLLIPPTSGWTLEAANSINDGGDIVGYGRIGGQEHAFLLTRYNGPDTQPPIAVATASPPAYANIPTISVAVKYWDNEKVVTATTQGSGTVYVRGPNLFSAAGTVTSWTTVDSQTVNTTYSIPGPGGSWGPEDNGTYEIWVAANRVSDLAGNKTPGGLIGTFTIGFQTTATLTIAGLSTTTTTSTTGTPVSLTLSATGSYPSAATDVFTFVIDWAGDGSDMQMVSGPTNTAVQHTYPTNGPRTVRVHCTDPHGVQSAERTAALNVTQQLAATTVVAAQVPGMPMNASMVAALNGGTMYFFGSAGTPNVYTWNYLTPGALPALTGTSSGTGGYAAAATDSRGRVITFGGVDSDGALSSARVYYPTNGGNAAAMPGALVPATSLTYINKTSTVTTTDGAGRIYIYSANYGVFYRYTAGTSGSGLWETLPVPPTTPGGISWDGADRIIVFGPTPAVYSISGNVWTQPLSAPSLFNHAALGADGLVYLVAPNQLWTFDPVLKNFGQIATTASDESGTSSVGSPIAFMFRGTDGFVYLISSGTEKFDTRPSVTTTPYISSVPVTTIVQGNPEASPWTYTIGASGKPRPTFSLDSGPAGMTLDGTTGIVTWMPTTNQLGTQTAVVRATNSVGTVTQTITFNVRSSIYADTIPPTGPTNVVVNVTSTTADLSWDPGTDNVSVTAYYLYNRTVTHSPKGSGSTTYHTLIGATSATSLHISGLKPYTTYNYELSSVDAAGNRSGYVPAGFRTTYIAPPGITNGNNGLSAGTYAIVGEPFTSYTFTGSGLPAATLAVVSAPAGALWNSSAGTSGNFIWTPVAGQEGDATFTLSGTNTSGSVTQSYTVHVYPAGTDLLAPTTPGGLTVDHVDSTTCRATWTASTDNHAVTGYRVTARHLDSRIHPPPYDDQTITTNVAATVLQTTVSGLQPSTTYGLTVQAFDAAGNVSAPAAAQITTLITPLAPQPGSQTGTQTASVLMVPNAGGTITLSWPGAGYYWGFTLESSSDLATWNSVAPASQWPSYATSFTVTPDPAMTRCFFRVKATPLAAP